MASCVALKRSFDHDRESNTNSTSKRVRRHFPVTVVSSPHEINDVSSTGLPSDFPDIQPAITSEILLNRIKDEVRRLQRRHQLKVPEEETNSTVSATSTTDQQNLLTLAQVNTICERLLKEREEILREEYDRILSKKLDEQHENFVRFTQDQLTRRFSELQFSYVS